MICLNSYDTGEFLRKAAEELHLSDVDLAVVLAEQRGLSFLKNVPLFNPRHVPSELSVEALYRGGIVPLFENGRIVSMCGIDPALVTRYAKPLQGIPFFQGAVSHIFEALDRSFALDSEATPLDTEIHTSPLVLDVLEELKLRACERNADCITCFWKEDELLYHFLCRGQPKYRGLISARISHSFMKLCRSRALTDPQYTADERTGSISLTVRSTEVDKLSADSTIREGASASCKPVLPDRSVRVLIVDDDPLYLSVLKRFLSSNGYLVSSARNGKQALAELESIDTVPNALVTDMHMPVMNGFELLHHLKNVPRYSVIPAIMLTDDDSCECELDGLKSGAVVVLAKGRDPRIMAAHIDRIIGSSSGALYG